MNNEQTYRILVYTRIPKDEYTESLANSIHFAYYDDCGNIQPLNQNYGVLFALATIDENNVIQEKGLKSPRIFRTDEGSFKITATRTDKFGNNDCESEGYELLWTSTDLINFESKGLVPKRDNIQKPDQAIVGIEDIIPGNAISVEGDIFCNLVEHWTPVYNVGIRVPETVTVTSKQDMEKVQATAIYSDGSFAKKRVEWDLNNVNFSKPGTYTIKGKAVQEIFQFPLAHGYADPVILPWNDKYYYLATNDNKDDIGIYVREGASIDGLFAPGYKESLILDVDEERNFIQTFWAPEFHIIGNDLCILFAVGGKQWAPQCHIMKLSKGGSIMNPADWSVPERIRRSDGTFLAGSGITLDMTYFKADGISCVVWSYREHIGTPLDTGSMLYIATIDEENPAILTSEPVLLSRPLFGWENIQGTINNEGPYPLITDNTVYIAYSGGAANGYTYAVCLLSISRGGDFLNPNAWTKASTPVLSYYSIDGIYGPGHNSFFRDYDGNTYIAYHAEEQIVKQGERCSAIHRVHFNKNNKPIFNMSANRDLNDSLTSVTMNITIN